jgi:hypothetical protein
MSMNLVEPLNELQKVLVQQQFVKNYPVEVVNGENGAKHLSLKTENQTLNLSMATQSQNNIFIQLFTEHTYSQNIEQVLEADRLAVEKFLNIDIDEIMYVRCLMGGAYLNLVAKAANYWRDGSVNSLDPKSIHADVRRSLMESIATSSYEPIATAVSVKNGLPIEILIELETSELPSTWLQEISTTYEEVSYHETETPIYAQVAYGRKVL